MIADAAMSGSDAVSPRSYEGHFGLADSPFALAPDPRYLFESQSHSAALEQLASAVPRHEALVVITGEVGTGKTTLCRAVADQRGARTLVAVLTKPPATADDLLRQILDQFGMLADDSGPIAKASRYELLRTLERFLASVVSLDAQAIVLVDEAQQLQPDVLEQIRTLSDLVTGNRQLVQIVLVGQPELNEVLGRPEMRALQQRITRRHHLSPLKRDEVRRYIARRVSVAQRGSEAVSFADPNDDGLAWQVPFTSSALGAVEKLSQGIPRLINVLCDRALESALVHGSAKIDIDAVLRAARTMHLRLPAALWITANRRSLSVAAGTVAVLAIGITAANMGRLPQNATPVAARPASTASGAIMPGEAGAPAATPPQVMLPTADAKPEDLVQAESFTIAVSSFRTPARATALAADMTRLDLPAFTRSTASGWQQVVVGPYLSHEEAAVARGRLAGAGMPDAQIMPGTGPEGATIPPETDPSSATTTRIVLLSPNGRASVLIDGDVDAPVVRRVGPSADGAFVVEIGPVQSHVPPRTLVAAETSSLVSEVTLHELSGPAGGPVRQVTVKTRAPAVGSVRVSGRRVYLDFDPPAPTLAPLAPLDR